MRWRVVAVCAVCAALVEPSAVNSQLPPDDPVAGRAVAPAIPAPPAPQVAEEANVQRDSPVGRAAAQIEPGSPTVEASAEQQQRDREVVEGSFQILFELFVVALLIETALAVIFNWRPFLELFDGRGVKTPIAILFSYIVVEAFNLDLFTKLTNLYTGGSESDQFSGRVLTALILAGGSAAVNNLFVALGFRAVRKAEEIAPKPPLDEAWIAVRMRGPAPKDPVNVRIGKAGETKVVGTIAQGSPDWPALRYFLRDPGRFPQSGGHAVKAPGEYMVELQRLGDQAPFASWGPFPIAPGAIIDINLRHRTDNLVREHAPEGAAASAGPAGAGTNESKRVSG